MEIWKQNGNIDNRNIQGRTQEFFLGGGRGVLSTHWHLKTPKKQQIFLIKGAELPQPPPPEYTSNIFIHFKMCRVNNIVVFNDLMTCKNEYMTLGSIFYGFG